MWMLELFLETITVACFRVAHHKAAAPEYAGLLLAGWRLQIGPIMRSMMQTDGR